MPQSHAPQRFDVEEPEVALDMTVILFYAFGATSSSRAISASDILSSGVKGRRRPLCGKGPNDAAWRSTETVRLSELVAYRLCRVSWKRV
jgi:hypothetical protein